MQEKAPLAEGAPHPSTFARSSCSSEPVRGMRHVLITWSNISGPF